MHTSGTSDAHTSSGRQSISPRFSSLGARYSVSEQIKVVTEWEQGGRREVRALIISLSPVEAELSVSGLFNWFLWNCGIDYLRASGLNA